MVKPADFHIGVVLRRVEVPIRHLNMTFGVKQSQRPLLLCHSKQGGVPECCVESSGSREVEDLGDGEKYSNNDQTGVGQLRGNVVVTDPGHDRRDVNSDHTMSRVGRSQVVMNKDLVDRVKIRDIVLCWSTGHIQIHRKLLSMFVCVQQIFQL